MSLSLLRVNTNSKLSSSNELFIVAAFNLPAIAACPNAGRCKTGCYATQGNYRFPSVQKAYASNYALVKRDLGEFRELVSMDINRLQYKLVPGQRLAVRIHTSGDFYSEAYYHAWVDLAEANPNVLFYAYTKMISQSYSRLRPFNFVLIFSEGGLEDNLIDTSLHRHSRVFSSLEELHAAGYDDVTTDDTMAFRSTSGKIGLVYHGAAKRAWTTTPINNVTDKTVTSAA